MRLEALPDIGRYGVGPPLQPGQQGPEQHQPPAVGTIEQQRDVAGRGPRTRQPGQRPRPRPADARKRSAPVPGQYCGGFPRPGRRGRRTRRPAGREAGRPGAPGPRA
ncbi:hypothetical protein GCM10010507_24490 [Streptomyces cinnamoneus]|uniref:Uncharacterized protein n=1 Tax=Streptomyces cinnamoneus TaxID=53446 RepID=A0A918TM47_STRCJ|nr:hypothetical protein GCM10010507_24490 [Streptomyces cinnamoneus]